MCPIRRLNRQYAARRRTYPVLNPACPRRDLVTHLRLRGLVKWVDDGSSSPTPIHLQLRGSVKWVNDGSSSPTHLRLKSSVKWVDDSSVRSSLGLIIYKMNVMPLLVSNILKVVHSSCRHLLSAFYEYSCPVDCMGFVKTPPPRCIFLF